VDFSRDIRPIFNQNCVSCHGGVRQKNGVSFIFRDEALGKGKSGRQTIVPGEPDASELVSRASATAGTNCAASTLDWRRGPVVRLLGICSA
jgi:mono/diheme cytochrome c family protein